MSTSAIQTFPPEIICEIFGHIRFGLQVHSPSSFPWNLGQVCKLWRAIFVSSPQFWNEFAIDLYAIYRHDVLVEQYGRALALTMLCVERSRGYPLSFRLDIPESHSGASALRATTYFHQILDVLVGESSRWIDVHLSLDEAEYPILRRITSLPLLRSLELFTNNSMFDVWDKWTDIFWNAPRLSRLKLLYISSWHFDWSTLIGLQIETLHLDKADVLLAALSQAKNLRYLICQRTSFQEFDQPHFPEASVVVSMPSLRALAIPNAYYLRHLQAPALQQLCVWDDHDYEPFSEAVIPFLRRSSCALEKLALIKCRASDAVAVMHETPGIKHLVLDGVWPLSDMLAELTYDWERPLVGHLQGLRLKYHFHDSNFPSLSEMIHSRTQPEGDGIEAGRSAVERLQKLALIPDEVYGSGGPAVSVSNVEAFRKYCDDRGVGLSFLDNQI
ncbi:hypothetical protein AMATHDRAFT_5578 [Amanita thiersii Skay4041]|uniref:Uncharacterized protein n=1 Tax=Amanita thiersii Skay4041 TaxID=703135 RepID=A0A2A9NLN6_9AGAR|nr:hypothetical protein AMATHDRAFT_5578 [Amanita thiersii Skay4041]